MRYSVSNAIRTPIISKVILLINELVKAGRKLPKGKKRKPKNISKQDQQPIDDHQDEMAVDIRHAFFDPILSQSRTLFVYAMRQLKGKDYLSRSVELVEEIQAGCYLIHVVGGWNEVTCAKLDMICDNIAEQLAAIAHTQKVQKSQSH